jgi:hypothetical protein
MRFGSYSKNLLGLEAPKDTSDVKDSKDAHPGGE